MLLLSEQSSRSVLEIRPLDTDYDDDDDDEVDKTLYSWWWFPPSDEDSVVSGRSFFMELWRRRNANYRLVAADEIKCD